jgi:hypothetical protein
MFGNLFGNATFSGSTLENLLLKRVSQCDLFSITDERANRFAESLLTEHPNFFRDVFQIPSQQRVSTLDIEVEKQLEKQTATGMANIALFFTMSSAAAASEFGKLIDRKQTNASTAYGLAWCLVEYAKSLSVPDKNLDSLFHGAFPAGLILWEGVALFGMLAPWKNVISEMNQIQPHPVAIDDSVIEYLKRMTPKASKAAMDQALQNLQQIKQLSLLHPDFLLRANMSYVITNPESSDTRRGPVGENPCSFCYGTGKQSSCGGCGGRGSIIKINEIIPCAVCGTSGRARCDYCGGTGKARAL